MEEEKRFCTTRKYSHIEGLQSEAFDTYELLEIGTDLLIRYRSERNNEYYEEARRIQGVSFDDIRELLIYLAENAARRGIWIDMVEDYLHGGVGVLCRL